MINDEKDFNKIINQKDNLILILQNEINFYKELYNKNNQTINKQMFNSINDNKINTINDIFINENKKLKKKLELYKNKIHTIQKNSNKNINKI